MGVAFLAGFLIIFNIVMWFVLLAKFNRWFSERFSTDKLVSSVKGQIDQLIKEMNRNTSRDIDLVDRQIQQLKEMIAKADRHLAVVRNELEKQEKNQAFSKKLQTATEKSAQPKASPKEAPQNEPRKERPSMAARATERYLAVASKGEEAYSVTEEGKKQISQQGDLFDVSEEPLAPFLETNTFVVNQEGAAYASVPVLEPKITYAEEPIVPKKDFSTQVRELYDRGNSVEEIATELGRSTTEVQFALDMGA